MLSQAFAYAQFTEDVARGQLEASGLTEEVLREKLLEKGIDIDNVNVDDPSEIIRVEEAINEIIQEQQESNLSDEVLDKYEESKSSIKKDTVERQVVVIESEKSKNEKNTPPGPESKPYKYGQSIFINKELKVFQRTDKIKPSDDYILGPGDEIGISIWGLSQVSQTYEVSERGFISPDRMEPIFLTGLTFGEAKSLLEKRFQAYYRFSSSEFKATLSYARDISVSIVGEVNQPGTYTLSAINSALNALMAAGGPSNIGSLREIKLLKAGQEPILIDVYKYLNNPTTASNFAISDNDIIHVPVAQKLITLNGAIIRGGRYEMKKEENLVSLFELAGGFRANAVLQNIQVKRFESDEEKILDVNFNEILEDNSDFSLLNGDEVYVNEIPDDFENYVLVEGAVNIPGKYAVNEASKILDVISKVEVSKKALTDISYISRINDDGKSSKYIFFNLTKLLEGDLTDNLSLKPKDKIVIFSKSRFADSQEFKIGGAVRDPNAFPIDQTGSITFRQAIFLAGGLNANAADYAYIKRKKSNKSTDIEYIRVDISDINSESLDDIIIMNGDDVVIYSNLEDETFVYVKIDGAVKNPGEFVFDESLNLEDVLSMAGGFKIEAAPYKVEVYRLQFDDEKKSRTLVAHLSLKGDFTSDNDFELKPFDQIYVREAPEFEFYKTVKVVGEVRFHGKYPVLKDNETITDIIERAGGFTDEAFLKGTTLFRNQNDLGYVVIDLEEAMNNKKSHFNLIVQDGDVIKVPKISNIVTIIGETQAKDLASTEITNGGKIHAPYESGKNAEYYIKKYAGGIGDKGKKELITVTFPTGDVRTVSKTLFWTKYPEVRPGSIIRIGSKEEEEKFKREHETKTDWGKVLTDSVAQATAILSLILLVNRVD